MIVDCHCHAKKGDLLTSPCDTDAPMETYLKRTKAAGIDKTVIFSPFHSNYQQANANTARIVAQYRARLLLEVLIQSGKFSPYQKWYGQDQGRTNTTSYAPGSPSQSPLPPARPLTYADLRSDRRFALGQGFEKLGNMRTGQRLFSHLPFSSKLMQFWQEVYFLEVVLSKFASKAITLDRGLGKAIAIKL